MVEKPKREDDLAVPVLVGRDVDRVGGGHVHEGEDGGHRGPGSEIHVRGHLLEQRGGAGRVRDERGHRELPRGQLPEARCRVDHVQVDADVVADRDAEAVEPGDDGGGGVEAQRLDRDRAAARQRQRQPARDLEDVGVPAGGVEDEDLLAVVRALDDGQQVVLALGQQGGRHRDVVHGVVDAVEADADPRRREEDQGEEAGPGGDQDALEPTAAPWRGSASGTVGPSSRGDRVRQSPLRPAARAPAPGTPRSPCPQPTDPPLPRRCPKGSMWLPWPRRDPSRRPRCWGHGRGPRPAAGPGDGGRTPVPLHLARRGQRPLVGLPLPPGRHRGQHPVQVGHHLGPDDLPAARVRHRGPARSPGRPLALAGPPGPAERRGLRTAGRAGRSGASSRRTPRSTACPSTTGPPTSWWAAIRSTWRSRSTTTATTSTAGAWRSSPGTPRPQRPPLPAAARVAARLHRLGRRPPGVARHPARGDAAPVRRLGPPARPQRRAGALRRPARRPRRRHAPPGGAARDRRRRRALARARPRRHVRGDAGAPRGVVPRHRSAC